MKVVIRVWLPDKPHKPHDGMPMTTILEHNQFNNPEIIGLGIPIERCKYNIITKALEIYLDEYPARIDADLRFEILHLLHADRVQYRPEAYTILDADKGKGIILWTNPHRQMAKEVIAASKKD